METYIDDELYQKEDNFYENTTEETKSVMYFKDNMFHGSSKSWYDTGELFSETNFEKDECNGKCVYYYKNGKVKSEVNYINGYKDDMEYEYYENGNIKSEKRYGTDLGSNSSYQIEVILSEENYDINGKIEKSYDIDYDTDKSLRSKKREIQKN